ncbi:hypothetical protein [Vallitalea sp.]|jgi:hypothetical protein|uniref:hypothetical protein n=1 Tax=Vallitalea sp. TaxID=1882829 RepID=UPI0025D2AC84|nr:hypothetical protein [Vallitalea sp.]MCT4687576.1 hypothetical protein [Vallitalea sp.]
MGKIKRRDFKFYHNSIITRNILENSFNYEIGTMLPEKFIESNRDIEEEYLDESDIIKNDLNGKKFLN